MKANINLKSFKKRGYNNFCAQIFITLNDGQKLCYACRTTVTNAKMILDEQNIFIYKNGAWQQTTVSGDIALLLSKSLIGTAKLLDKACVKAGQDSIGSYTQPYSDTVLFVGDMADDQIIKIGSLTIYASRINTDKPYTLKFKHIDNLDDIARNISNLPNHDQLLPRIQKQLEFGHKQAMNAWRAKPIGFKSYKNMANYRHSVGQYAKSHSQYNRERRYR